MMPSDQSMVLVTMGMFETYYYFASNHAFEEDSRNFYEFTDFITKMARNNNWVKKYIIVMRGNK